MASLLIYSMQTIWFPTGICEKIDQMTHSFIWKGSSDSKSFTLVNWETITLPKRNGGLGIHRARETNIALLGKIIWRLLTGEAQFWGDILLHKYLGGHALDQFRVNSSCSYLWCGIVKAWNVLKDGFTWQLGRGNSSFWYDRWLPIGKLCDYVTFVHITDSDHIVRDV